MMAGHAPRVKYFVRPGRTQSSFSVTIADQPRVVANSLPPRLVNQMSPLVMQCIGHKEIAVDVLDAERGVAGRDFGIFEAAIGGYWFIVMVKDIDRAASKVGREE